MSQDKVHIMVDLETYDVNPSAVILSIGACVIDAPEKRFYLELDPTTQFERTVSMATKEWWSKQPMPIPIGSCHLYDALAQFTFWIRSFNAEPVIWCKGTDFDVAILTHAYNQMSVAVPWKYNNTRDCRTIFKIANYTPKKAEHNALQDAIEQADDLLWALNKLNGALA